VYGIVYFTQANRHNSSRPPAVVTRGPVPGRITSCQCSFKNCGQANYASHGQSYHGRQMRRTQQSNSSNRQGRVSCGCCSTVRHRSTG
jgi:hypothetical protein